MLCCRSLSLCDILREHRNIFLPVDEEDRIRITIRRKHILADMLHKLRSGLNTSKHLKVTFVGEPAVDAGGPLREFLHHLIEEVSQNNSFLCGSLTARVPRHSVTELDRRSFYYIGVMLALSLIHGGPAPQFFSPAVADYIVSGIQGVKPTTDDVPDSDKRKSLEAVWKIGCYCYFYIILLYLCSCETVIPRKIFVVCYHRMYMISGLISALPNQ